MNLTEYDKTLGLAICSMTVIGLVAVLMLHLFAGLYFADELALVISSFWFGATVTWFTEKFLLHREPDN